MIYSVCLDAYFKSNINININIKTKVSSLNHLLLEFIIWDIYETHYWTPPMFMFSLFRRLSKCPPFSVNLQRDLRGDLWVQIMIIDKHSDGTQHSTTPYTNGLVVHVTFFLSYNSLKRIFAIFFFFSPIFGLKQPGFLLNGQGANPPDHYAICRKENLQREGGRLPPPLIADMSP